VIAAGKRERAPAPAAEPSLRRRSAVLVTGASSGIGFATAVRLARRGTIVFAGIRRQVDGEALLRENSDRIKPMLLDVTDEVSLQRARARIESLREFRLDALVNNAGIAIAGPLELLPQAELRRQFEVNFFAPLALTQAFLPLLRESGGRIVNVSSIAGKLAVPYLGAYSASKFALEAASDALRLELRPFGVSVSIVEPGDVRTPIWRRSSEAGLRLLEQLPADERAQYEESIRARAGAAQRAERTAIAPERVAFAIERALFARRPRARYLVGVGARLRLGVARLPEALRDPLILAAMGLPRGAARRESAVNREPV
jgi:NAD(P)-dependent dehydrogenase (short-subunit alcohol dehydrogenase family)